MKYNLAETGKRIKAIRKENGLTQEQFAEKFNALDYLILGINRKE